MSFFSLFLVFCTGIVRSFYHKAKESEQLSKGSLKAIAKDLNKAFSNESRDDHADRTLKPYVIVPKTVKKEYIKEVYVFTWLRMAHELTVSFLVH